MLLTNIGAFLDRRQMCVQTSNYTSSLKLVKGGSPQGTKLGNFLLCFAIDDITEFISTNTESLQSSLSSEPLPEQAFPPHYQPSFTNTPARNTHEESFNPNPLGIWNKKNVLYDTVPIEIEDEDQYRNAMTWEIGYIDDLNIGQTLKISSGLSHITTSKEKREIRASGCEEMYGTIEKNGKTIGMQINPMKTQLLCIHANNYLDVATYISLEERKLESTNEMKILGFMFNNKPSPKAHVDFLISKFHRHVWSLFHLKRAGLPNDTIVEVYN